MNKYKWTVLVLLVAGLFITEYYLLGAKKKFENKTKSKNKDSSLLAPNLTIIPQNKDTIDLTWQLLKNIDYVDIATEEYPQGIMNPIINKRLKELKGAYITISGHAIPMDEKSYALSENVMATCFFCGMAGPESIMGIAFKDKAPNLETDQFLTLIGKFDYNDSNPDDWIYHIKEAKLLTP
ncbi:hypothetical protein [Autumnicola musiva]|uniref:DUF3299 domain-containing protein n=1 Tax=Autumnicola musiva TaxID=3075589 RepID=A0ABU3DC49_9FLAO|nr:hypothetical protein [Zunongwangia sp. F117]MDT0678543.1 hypothetical protein [Zunongwangia sp. F117]